MGKKSFIKVSSLDLMSSGVSYSATLEDKEVVDSQELRLVRNNSASEVVTRGQTLFQLPLPLSDHPRNIFSIPQKPP